MRGFNQWGHNLHASRKINAVNTIRVMSILSVARRYCCNFDDEAPPMRLYPMLNARKARAMGDDRGDDACLAAASSWLLISLTVDMIWKRSNDAADLILSLLTWNNLAWGSYAASCQMQIFSLFKIESASSAIKRREEDAASPIERERRNGQRRKKHCY